jgi:hypothetical protein
MKDAAKELVALNAQLDAQFEEMEESWAIYKVDRGNELKLERYVISLRLANELWKEIKAKTI